jgi:glucosamine--fructose-6-phosphate aminotransferase (isomerizing)
MALDAVVRLALLPIHGTFGLVVAFADQPDLLIGARRGSPLIIGVGEHEFFLASDASAVVVREELLFVIRRGRHACLMDCRCRSTPSK